MRHSLALPSQPRLSSFRAMSLPLLMLAILAPLMLLAARWYAPPALTPPAARALPLAFVPNAGQTDAQVRYQAHGLGGSLFFTAQEVVLALPSSPAQAEPRAPAIVRVHFEGAGAQPDIVATEQLPGVFNYMLGNDRSRWRSNLHSYGGLVYKQLYPGIDMRYEGSDGSLKSTYNLAAHANASLIRWRYTTAAGLRVDQASGDLQITLPHGAGEAGRTLTEHAPVAWQDLAGTRVPVAVRYDLAEDGSIGFKLGRYDSAQPLTIDPTLQYSSFIGGGAVDEANDVAVANIGGVDYAFVTGYTFNNPFPPAVDNTFISSGAARPDVFVMRLDPNVSGAASRIYTTIVGGAGADKGNAIAVDSAGNAYVAGVTGSDDFPVTANALDNSNASGDDAFVLVLNPSGGGPLYNSYLGVTGTESAQGIALHGSQAYVVGSTSGGSFPSTSGAIDSSFVGGTEAFLTVMDSLTTTPAISYSTLLAGSGNEVANAVAVDASGDAYLTGMTTSASGTLFPVKAGSFDTSKTTADADAFVIKIDPSGTGGRAGTALVYGSYLGGSGADIGNGIAILGAPGAEQAYITGSTNSPSASFPISAGVFQPVKGAGTDAFVSSLNATGTALNYSTFLGGNGNDSGYDIALQANGTAFVVGSTASSDFAGDGAPGPSTNSLQDYAGSDDAFVFKLSAGGSVRFYNTYLGGAGSDIGRGIALDTTNRIYVVGSTDAASFPVSSAPAGYQTSFGGSVDGFFARIGNTAPSATNDSYTVNEDSVLTVAAPGVLGNDTDPDDSSINAILVSGPAHGSLTLNANGSFSYTPSADYNGPDSFTYNADDGTSTSQASVSISVSAIDDAPVNSVPAAQTTYRNVAIVFSSANGNALSVSDVDAGSGLQVSLTVAQGTLTLNSIVGLSFSTGDGSADATMTFVGSPSAINTALDGMSYTPTTNYVGADTLNIVSDDQGNSGSGGPLSDTDSVGIDVTFVNHAPSLLPGGDVSVLEDSGAYGPTGWATNIVPGPIDELGQAVTLTTSNDNSALFSAQPAINPATGNLTFTPAPNAYGTSTVTVTLKDDGGTANGGQDTANFPFSITIAPVNDQPSFTGGASQTVLEDAGAQTVAGWASAISRGAANESSQTLSFVFTANDNPSLFSAGPAVDSSGALTFTPAANANGLANLTLVLRDDGGTANGGVDSSGAYSFTITVTGVNDAPSISGNISVLEDAGAQSLAGWAQPGPANELAQTLSASISSNSNPALFAASPALASDGTLSFTPAPNANGSATINLTLTDNGGTSNGGQDSLSTSFTITVAAVNDAPSFTPGPDVSVAEDSGTYGPSVWASAISTGPADESSQRHGFSVANSQPSLFSAQPSIDTSGALAFTPAPNAFGVVTVTALLRDSGGTASGGQDTASHTFYITITPVNDNPTANDDIASIAKDSGPTRIDVLANDTIAPDAGETLTITTITQGANGSVALTGGGTALTYTPKPHFSGTDVFSYTIADGNGGTAAASVHITVGGFRVFLPTLMRPPLADLVASFRISPATVKPHQQELISVTITNQGEVAASQFWVDFYINPDNPPTASNQPWDKRCGARRCAQGIAWYVERTLAPGESITLTSTPDSYYKKNTDWDGAFEASQLNLYVYVDSWNPGAGGGAVDESNEANNRAELHLPAALAAASELGIAADVDRPALPERPARPEPAH